MGGEGGKAVSASVSAHAEVEVEVGAVDLPEVSCLLLDCIISDGGNHAEKEGSQSQPPL